MSQTAKVIQFAPRPKPDPRDDKYRTAAIDRSKTVVVEAWLIDALLRHHQIMDDFLSLMCKTSKPGGAA